MFPLDLQHTCMVCLQPSTLSCQANQDCTLPCQDTFHATATRMPAVQGSMHTALSKHIVLNSKYAYSLRQYVGHSGLTGSRLDDTLPLPHPHMLSACLPQQWALAAPDMADQATATSPLHAPVRHPPVRAASSISGQHSCYAVVSCAAKS